MSIAQKMLLSMSFLVLLNGAARDAWAAEEASVKQRVLQNHKGSVMSLSFSPDLAKLATSSRDGTIKIWDIASGKLERTLTGHTEDVYCVAYSPDGALLASGSGDKSIRLWDAKTFEVIRTLDGHTQVVRWVSFSRDGRMLASTGADLTIRLWDVASGKEIKSLRGHANVVKMVHFLPAPAAGAGGADEKKLVSAAADGTVRIWDVESGQETALLAGHTNSVECVSPSGDGKLLASSSNDGTIRIWDVASSQPVHILLGHVSEVDSVTFMPDGKTVISGGKDKTIRFWDAHSGEQRGMLTGHTGRVESLEISPDGKTLASGGGGGDTSVRIWDLSAGVPGGQGAGPENAASSGNSTKPQFTTAGEKRRPPMEFDGSEVDQLWRLLGNDDGDDVGVAMRRLVSGGDKAVAALAPRLSRAAEPPTPQQIEQLISRLDNGDPLVREQVTCDLIQAGGAIEQPVREALKRKLGPEVRHRLEMALRDVTTKEPGQTRSAAEVLREANCIKALEEIGTPAARELAKRMKG